jgi:hypothetical protein
MIRTSTLTVAMVSLYIAAVSVADELVLVNDVVKTSVRSKLIAARISETRGRYLIAQFRSMDDEKREIIMKFPAHGLTTHEQTMRAVIKSCTKMDGEPDKHDWHLADMEAEFYLPRIARFDDPEYSRGPVILDHSDLVRCSLILIHRSQTM